MRLPIATNNPSYRLRGRLSATEKRVWAAFTHGEFVDLRTGDKKADDPANADQWPASRTVRAEVIAALLLGLCPPVPGAVAALRLAGARITGRLFLDHGTIDHLLMMRECRFDDAVVIDDASTESIDLNGSYLTAFSAYYAHVRGTLDLRDTTVVGENGLAVHASGIKVDGALLANRAEVHGSFGLINAQIGGQLTLIGAKLRNPVPDGVALHAGGVHVGRSLLAQGIETVGELRIPGARIGSSLLLRGALLNGNGRAALHGDALSVASEADFQVYTVDDEPRMFTAVGPVRLLGARFGDELNFSGARLTTDEEKYPKQPALDLSRVSAAGSVALGKGLRTSGELRLTGARITGHLDLHRMASPDAKLTLYAAHVSGGVRDDDLDCWPARLNLDGFTYGPFADFYEASARIPLLARQIRRTTGEPGGFRAQPYEQLAAYYRSLGYDGDARTVLLAKRRANRAKLRWWRRLPGYLQDAAVGYGYRPLRAVGWAITLLTASSAYFSTVRPTRVNPESTAEFNPVLYAADHLIPIIKFGQQDSWEYHGIPAVVTVVLTVLGWILGIAIAAAAGRTFNRN